MRGRGDEGMGNEVVSRRGGDAVWRRSMCAARSGRRRGLADSGARATAMGAMGRNGRDERNGLQWVAMGAPSMRRIRRRHFGGPRQGGAPTFPRPPAIGCFLARAAIASGSCERRQARTRRRPLRRALRLSRLRDAGARTRARRALAPGPAGSTPGRRAARNAFRRLSYSGRCADCSRAGPIRGRSAHRFDYGGRTS